MREMNGGEGGGCIRALVDVRKNGKQIRKIVRVHGLGKDRSDRNIIHFCFGGNFQTEHCQV